MLFKNLLIILLLSGIQTTMFSQSLLEDGVEWRYNYYRFAEGLIGYNSCSIEGDTLIDGKNCKKYIKTYGSCDLRPTVEYLYEEDKMVYYYDTMKQKFSMIYDYSAELGDTIAIENWEWINLEEDSLFYIRIDSIATFEYGPYQLKEFHVTYDKVNDAIIDFPDGDWAKGIIIEQIGSLTNYFHFYDNGLCDANYNIGLRCFSTPEFEPHVFGEIACDSLIQSSVFTIEENIMVFPNPFDQEFTVQADYEIHHGEIVVYNLNGMEVYRKNISNKSELNETIDMSSFPSSIYFIKVFDEHKGLQLSKKIIKN